MISYEDLGKAPKIPFVVGDWLIEPNTATMMQIPRRVVRVVEYMNWLARYLESRPTDAQVRALYWRLEPYGA